MKEIRAFQTSDDQLFADQAKAGDHQIELNLGEYLDAALMGTVDRKVIKDFIMRKRQEITWILHGQDVDLTNVKPYTKIPDPPILTPDGGSSSGTQ